MTLLNMEVEMMNEDLHEYYLMIDMGMDQFVKFRIV